MAANVVMTQALRNAAVAASGQRVPNELQGLGARARRGRAALGSSRWRTWRARRPSPPTPATTCSRSGARSCRRGPTAFRSRGGFRTGHGPLIDPCSVRRFPDDAPLVEGIVSRAPWRRRTARLLDTLRSMADPDRMNDGLAEVGNRGREQRDAGVLPGPVQFSSALTLKTGR